MLPIRLKELPAEPAGPANKSGVTVRYLGCQEDRVGKASLEPDGTPDCLVSIQGLPPGKPIQKAKLTGPREGIWLSDPNPQRWLLKTNWQQHTLLVSFSYWAPGPHRLQLTFDDGTQQTVAFQVPVRNAPYFQANLDVHRSNVHILHKQEPLYTSVMTSCLKHILESYPLALHGNQAPAAK